MVRFSEAFNLNKTQMELDFVDIPLDTDIKLFVDPYAISIREEDWFVECSELIVSYFNKLIASIRNKDKFTSLKLLNNLSEPNETHFGHSIDYSQGNGVGPIQGNDLYKALNSSKAVETGDLNDLADCNLMIDGIGPDKVSDIAINIIRKKLAIYTKEQCELYNIETRRCSLKPHWDKELNNWKNDYYDLPVYNGNAILLCPKLIVRYHLLLNDKEFYKKDILEFLQAEHLNAGSALVEALKNGKLRVTKKKLQEQPEYKRSKEFIYNFVSTHPEILTEYKKRKLEQVHSVISNKEIEEKLNIDQSIDVNIDSIIKKMNDIEPGNNDASKYHNICIDIINTLFYPDLSFVKKEKEINEGRKRIDIIATNTSREGFFYDLSVKYHIKAPIIMMECKNYSQDINNPELDQIAGRLSEKRGKFGILFCRNIENKTNIIKKLKDYLNDDKKYIIILEDYDLIKLLDLKKHNNSTEIQHFLYSKLNEILL